VCRCNRNLEPTAVELLEDFVDSVTTSNKSVSISIDSTVLLYSVTAGLIKCTHRSRCSEVHLPGGSICICPIAVISRRTYSLSIVVTPLTTSASSQNWPARPGTQRRPVGLGVQVLLSQVPSKTVDVRFTPVGKIIRRAGDRDKDIKEVAAGVSDTSLRELEGMVRLSISKM